MADQQSGRFSVIPTRAVFDPNLDNAALRVLAMLGTFSDANGWCYPSISKLAARSGVSRRAINLQIAALKSAGYLEVREQHRANGSRTVNLYRILMDSGDPVGFEGDRGWDRGITGDGIGESQGDGIGGSQGMGSGDHSQNVPSERPISETLTHATHTDDARTRTSAEQAPTHASAHARKGEPKHEPERFAKFWQRYPRKEGKAAAIKAWDKLRADQPTRAAMAQALADQFESQPDRDPRFIPHASRWLNDRRWEDETPQASHQTFPAI